MSRLQGQPLSKIWKDLSDQQKANYAAQLAGFIRQWRKLTSPDIEKVNHDLLDDIVIGQCSPSKHPPCCKQIGRNTDTWFENLIPELRKGISKIQNTSDLNEIETRLQELKRKFPKGYPNVLTHGDLHLANIFVHNDKIEAIIDWECSGFYPAWVESYLLLKAGDFYTDEMAELLWQDGCLDFGLEDLREQIFPGLKPVINAWKRCPVEHPDAEKAWIKPRFCECRPYAGWFKWVHIGHRLQHKILD